MDPQFASKSDEWVQQFIEQETLKGNDLYSCKKQRC
jgi:hypothetical protein